MNGLTMVVAVASLAAAVMSCGDKKAASNSAGAAAPGGAAAPAGAAASPPPSAAPIDPASPSAHGLVKAGLLPVGTVIRAELVLPMSSLSNKPGEVVEASVIDSVFDSSGALAIWGGARLDLRIVTLAPVGGTAKPTGRVELEPVALKFGSDVVPISGTVDSIPYLARGSNIIVERATLVTVHLSRRVTLHP